MKSLKELQRHWYAKAAAAGFQDIEEPLEPGSPLKNAVASSNLVDQGTELATATPTKYDNYTSFQYSNMFAAACKEAVSHGNSSIDEETLKHIWALRAGGVSFRAIASDTGLSKTAVERVINKLENLMHLLGDDMQEETSNVVVITRAYEPAVDDPFIHSTWRNALWYGMKPLRDASLAEQFYKDASKYIKILLRAPTTVVRVACRKDDSSHIIGYAVLSTTNLDWVYVKADYRKQGIGSLLAKGFKTVAKPRTTIGAAIAQDKQLEVLSE